MIVVDDDRPLSKRVFIAELSGWMVNWAKSKLEIENTLRE